MNARSLPLPAAVTAEVRGIAVTAACRIAARESLPLNRATIDQLVEAIIDDICQPLLIGGFRLACDRVEQYIGDIDRYLITPARRRAEAGQDTADTLYTHLQYLAGMHDLHTSVQAEWKHLTADPAPMAAGARTAQPEPRTSHRPLPLLRETT
ncbi:hypothetical protein [Actinoplanes sp. NPDC051859]|uniref:hypothetical protein n=1 Tax=Actinoplanes sp. NPDC051859 TaxID=3363909 RepID=UPI0037BB8568